MTEDHLKELLRQRAHRGQAPADYAHHLLRSVQRRQRSELLRQPLWRIVWDRLQTAFSEHSLSTPAYAGALAGLTVIGLFSIFTIGSASRSLSDGVLARNLHFPAAPTAPSNLSTPSNAAPPTSAASLVSSQDKTAPATEPGKPAKRPVETVPVRFEKP